MIPIVQNIVTMEIKKRKDQEKKELALKRKIE